MVQCSDRTLYTGITNDLNRRIDQHNTSRLGAKYTRSRRPVSLVYAKLIGTRSEASKEEYRIKRLSKKQKLKLIGENQ